jgi:Mg-chelatase subunit ChlD
LKDSDPGKPFPGLIDTWCGNPIEPLTANRGKLQSTISSMQPKGETYIADGVMWGLRVLSEIEPFTEAANATSGAGEVEKVMILMTDGDNVRAPSLPNSSAHNDTDTKKADDYTRQACAEVKNAEVSLYTISFGREVSANGKALMETCADPEQFYDATDVDKISEAFESIAASIADIRLTQ